MWKFFTGDTTPPPNPTTFRLRGESSGRCLDVTGATATNGTQLIVWDCHGGANQQWNVNTSGTVTNVQTGLCLDVNETANNSAATVATCNNSAGQRWDKA